MVNHLFDSLTSSLVQSSPFAFILSYLGGILISFTSCVYPVIPLTLAFVGAMSAGSHRKGFLLSLFYVLGISVTYTTMGGAAALSGKLFGQIQASPFTSLILGNIFLLMGLAMMEVFQLPSLTPKFLSKKNPQKTERDVFQIFLIGITSGFAFGPCTAPVLATLLSYVATKQNLLFGMGLLFTFSLGMGTLLIILGTFAGLLTSLPKAGKWLAMINRIAGLTLVIMAEYFFIRAGMLWI